MIIKAQSTSTLIDPSFDLFVTLNTLIRAGKLPGPVINNDLAPHDLLKSYAGGNNFTDQDLWGASLVLTKQLGINVLKFIGAYRGLRSHVGTDDDGLYFDLVGSELGCQTAPDFRRTSVHWRCAGVSLTRQGCLRSTNDPGYCRRPQSTMCSTPAVASIHPRICQS